MTNNITIKYYNSKNWYFTSGSPTDTTDVSRGNTHEARRGEEEPRQKD